MVQEKRLPVVAVTMGDPAGVGREVIVKALSGEAIRLACRPVVIGDLTALRNAARVCGTDLTFNPVAGPEAAVSGSGAVDVVDLGNVDFERFEWGRVQAACGRAAYDYIARAVSFAMEGRVDAIATAPINKEALKAAGVSHIGHTEILGSLTGTADPLTMFETRGLRVFFLTRHVSLREACALVTKDRILDALMRVRTALTGLGIRGGTIAVAGLNPHSGEHGLFGTEEIDEIEPAVREAQKQGLDVAGPIGADSVFHQALSGKYVAVLSLYHDQGHIACKTLDFDRTISVTLGMPILRTSVDHGTAFDIAGSGAASEVSMREAILVAAKYAPMFRR